MHLFAFVLLSNKVVALFLPFQMPLVFSVKSLEIMLPASASLMGADTDQTCDSPAFLFTNNRVLSPAMPSSGKTPLHPAVPLPALSQSCDLCNWLRRNLLP